MSNTHVVGISDCKISAGPNEYIVTYALGSCIGLSLYDPESMVGGILHLMLPDSKFRSHARDFNPFMFADTGFAAFMARVQAKGADRSRICAKVVGGANMLEHSSVLDIGRRNEDAIMALLEIWAVPVLAKSTGGCVGRSMRLDLTDGSVLVRLLGRGEERL